MPNPNRFRSFKTSRLFPLGLIAAAATAALGDTPGVGPTSRPVDPNEPAELLRSANEALAATRPAAPATKPTTGPTAEVSADARKELDALRDAYKGIGTLKLAGTITSDIDIAGQSQKGHGAFDATFSGGRTDGVGKFRHASREVAEGSTPSPDSVIVGSTGEKLYVHQPARRVYVTADAPKARPTGTQLGEDVNRLLASQNPSLLLAVVNDAAAEVLDGVTKVEKGDDVRIGEQAYPALRVTAPKGVTMTMAIDPATHLLRQVTTDLADSLRQAGQPDVSKVLITIDYTATEVGAAMPDDQFAWAAPQGTKDVTTKSAKPGMLAEGPATPDAFAKNLEGKVAPDFTLKGMDGKDVKLSELKGSVVLIDFWATWCGPCVKSLPELNKTYEAKKEAGLKAFAVNVKEDKDDVEAFVKESKLTIPVLLDSEGKTGDLYKYPGIPATLVIGKDGTVKRAVIGSGPKNHAALEKAIEEALK